jgi:Uncharacterized protein conserved in bacteria (DUF2252)
VDIVSASRRYEQWLGQQTPLVRKDLSIKHQRMAESAFAFLRGTFYRWMQLWPSLCSRISDAPAIPCVGDLHVANFGTWRDSEGRLIWGVNDVDEVCELPYTNDLVRLATSAVLAGRHGHFHLTIRELSDAILDGYTTALDRDGGPFVLEEHHRWLRLIAHSELRDPKVFWAKLVSAPKATGTIPHALFKASMPESDVPYRVVRRVAGVGSLGRQRLVALAEWGGALIAREVKAWVPSAVVWATGRTSASVDCGALLSRAVRVLDPFFRKTDGWLVRRLSPDCSRIELEQLPRVRDEERLLGAMGWETANLHLGRGRTAIRRDLRKRPRRWLETAAVAMADAVEADWRDWVRTAG